MEPAVLDDHPQRVAGLQAVDVGERVTVDQNGDERNAFMSDCPKAPATPSQQEKMKKCNADAEDASHGFQRSGPADGVWPAMPPAA